MADRYVLGRELGRGGMGVVFEAFDSRLERRVAVKVLDPPAAGGDEAVARFHREALAAGRVGHENICDVRDRGVTGDGSPFIVMELLEGEPLSTLLEREGRLQPIRAVHLVLQVLAALRAAHAVGVVHRDLKPANVFVEGADPLERVKLVDFGISRFERETAPVEADRRSGPVGTPRYMSPEQARGETAVDLGADLWAVGVILYEALTGVPAFDGESHDELVAAILKGDPRPPRSLVPGLPAALDAAVLRALARDPEERFPGAAELAAELSRAVEARPDGSAARPGASRARRAGLAGVPPIPGGVERSTPSTVTLRNECLAASADDELDGEEPARSHAVDRGALAPPIPGGVERSSPSAVTRTDRGVARRRDRQAEPTLRIHREPSAPAAEAIGPAAGPRARRALLALAAALGLGAVLLGAVLVLGARRRGETAGPETGPASRQGEGREGAGRDEAGGEGGGAVLPSPPVRAEVRLEGLPVGSQVTFEGRPVAGAVVEGEVGRRGVLEVTAPNGDGLVVDLVLVDGRVVDLSALLGEGGPERDGP